MKSHIMTWLERWGFGIMVGFFTGLIAEELIFIKAYPELAMLGSIWLVILAYIVVNGKKSRQIEILDSYNKSWDSSYQDVLRRYRAILEENREWLNKYELAAANITQLKEENHVLRSRIPNTVEYEAKAEMKARSSRSKKPVVKKKSKK